jgi:hypothetical protein
LHPPVLPVEGMQYKKLSVLAGGLTGLHSPRPVDTVIFSYWIKVKIEMLQNKTQTIWQTFKKGLY